MKALKVLLILGIITLCSPSLAAQTTLSFARVMDSRDLPSTGFAVVNPGSASATVLFSLYRSDGSLADISTQTVPGGGQFARLGRELFDVQQTGGWVQMTSGTSNLRGFWIGGDFATYTDGAEAVSASNEFIIPIVTPESEVDIVNPGVSEGGVLIRLFTAEGLEVADPEIQVLKPKGSYRQTFSAIFPAGLGEAVNAKVTCMMPCAGSTLIRNFITAPALAVVNGRSTASTATELNFAHVVQGPQTGLNYSSVASITNLTSTIQTVTLTFTPDGGTSSVSVQREIAGNGTIRATPQNLFGTAGFTNGWMKVTSELPIAGALISAETTRHGLAVTPAASSPSNRLIMAHIADLVPWSTGIALLNPRTTSATVDMTAVTPNGNVIGRTQITIPAGRKVARLLSEWIPQTQSRTADGGFVFIESTVPLYGMELFFTRNLEVLSNVPAFGLGPGELPPPAAGP